MEDIENSKENTSSFEDFMDGKRINWDDITKPINRPRGILSQTDRQYLFGEKEYKHPQSESNRRQEIRERIESGILDFTLLLLLLPTNERKKLFSGFSGAQKSIVLEFMISFVYLLLGEDTDRFEKIIEDGIFACSAIDPQDQQTEKVTNVDVTIEIESDPDVDAIYQKFKNDTGTRLTPTEIGILVRNGKIDSDDLDALSRPANRKQRIEAALTEITSDMTSEDDV